MRRISSCFVVLVLAACTGDGSENGQLNIDDSLTERSPTSTTVETGQTTQDPGTTLGTETSSTAPPLDAVSVDLEPIFDLVGYGHRGLQAIGFDERTGQFVSYVKDGSGAPEVTYVDSEPEHRSAFTLIDDGGGGRAEESHAIAGDLSSAFDVYWSGHGITDVLAIPSGSDALVGGRPGRVFALGRLVIFDDVTNSPDPNHSTLLRANRVEDVSGQMVEHWTLELPGFPVDVVAVGVDQYLISTRPPSSAAPTPDQIHLVIEGKISKTIEAPNGLVRLQSKLWEEDDPKTCVETVDFDPSGATGIVWDIDEHRQLLTACRDGIPISTTEWCCDLGWEFGAMDSNSDGVLEVYVGGGPTASGVLPGLYSLVDGVLDSIRTEDGVALHVPRGHPSGLVADAGCRNDLWVHVYTTSENTATDGNRTGSVERIFYRIDGHTAEIVNVEHIEWDLEYSVEDGEWFDPFEVYYEAPPEIVSDLTDCGPPTRFPLAGSDGLAVQLEARPLSNARSCEVEWPRPYRELLLRKPDGSTMGWDLAQTPIGYLEIDQGDFLSVADGRFAFMETFTCSHEGSIKTVYSGRYDTSSGELITLQRVDPPPDYVIHSPVHQTHPDRLVVAANGDIVGELGGGANVQTLVINPVS